MHESLEFMSADFSFLHLTKHTRTLLVATAAVRTSLTNTHNIVASRSGERALSGMASSVVGPDPPPDDPHPDFPVEENQQNVAVAALDFNQVYLCM